MAHITSLSGHPTTGKKTPEQQTKIKKGKGVKQKTKNKQENEL
jgi:hypothetical protein